MFTIAHPWEESEMRHEKVEETTHIYLDAGETEQQVLRAIVNASFEMARPAGLGFLHFSESQQMTDEMADQFINLRQADAVSMDYVQGRQCKTYLSRRGEGHFVMSNYVYERDRGTPDQMLNRAKEILTGKETTGFASTTQMFKGENLDLRMKEHGFTRNAGESDWNFRKRVFPDLYSKSPDEALEFLYGASAAEWDELDKVLFFALLQGGKPDRRALEKFARGFAGDPLPMREKRQAAK